MKSCWNYGPKIDTFPILQLKYVYLAKFDCFLNTFFTIKKLKNPPAGLQYYEVSEIVNFE